MKKVTRTFGFVLAVALISSSFVGCGTTKGTSPATPTASASTQEVKKDPVKLQYGGAVAPESGPQAVVDNFNKLDKNVQVEYTKFTNDDSENTKLDITLMSGADIDIFTTYTDALMAKRVANGSALDLGDLAKKSRN